MIKDNYLTPKEFLQKYPRVRKIWDYRAIGYLLMLKLVRGKKLKRGCFVFEQDVLLLYKNTFEQ